MNPHQDGAATYVSNSIAGGWVDLTYTVAGRGQLIEARFIVPRVQGNTAGCLHQPPTVVSAICQIGKGYTTNGNLFINDR